MEQRKHCDDYIMDFDLPNCIKYYLLINRLPAIDKCVVVEEVGNPKCFATWEGKRVRLVMASRMGDIGITPHLDQENGYERRVWMDELSDFSKES